MTWIATIQSAALSLAAVGCVAVAALASPGEEQQAPDPAPKAESQEVPNPPAAETPIPTSSVVDVVVRSASRPDLSVRGLGTIIASTPEASFVLTSLNGVEIAADPTDGRPQVRGEIHVGGAAGESVDVEWRGLALIRFRPGRILPAARVVARDRVLTIGQELTLVDHLEPGRGPSTRPARINELNGTEPAQVPAEGPPGNLLIVCNVSPSAEDSGGAGLFLEMPNGAPQLAELVGVFRHSSNGLLGLYIGPEAIHRLLDRNGLGLATNPRPASPSDAPTQARRDPQFAPPPEIADSEVLKQGLVALIVEGSATPMALGTVISSTERESIALTAGSIFTSEGGAPSDPKRFGRKVTVYYARPRTPDSVPVPPVWGTAGEVVDFDPTRNVGLVRFRPGEKLGAMPIVPTSWKPTRGASAFVFLNQTGESGEIPRTIRNPSVVEKIGGVDYEAIECEGSPARTNVGAPLMALAVDVRTSAVAGVCNYSSPQDDAGYYAAPAMIYHILDANGLSDLYRKGNDAFRLAPPLPFHRNPGASTNLEPDRIDRVERRMEEMDRKLDRLLETLEGKTPR